MSGHFKLTHNNSKCAATNEEVNEELGVYETESQCRAASISKRRAGLLGSISGKRGGGGEESKEGKKPSSIVVHVITEKDDIYTRCKDVRISDPQLIEHINNINNTIGHYVVEVELTEPRFKLIKKQRTYYFRSSEDCTRFFSTVQTDDLFDKFWTIIDSIQDIARVSRNIVTTTETMSNNERLISLSKTKETNSLGNKAKMEEEEDVLKDLHQQLDEFDRSQGTGTSGTRNNTEEREYKRKRKELEGQIKTQGLHVYSFQRNDTEIQKQQRIQHDLSNKNVELTQKLAALEEERSHFINEKYKRLTEPLHQSDPKVLATYVSKERPHGFKTFPEFIRALSAKEIQKKESLGRPALNADQYEDLLIEMGVIRPGTDFTGRTFTNGGGGAVVDLSGIESRLDKLEQRANNTDEILARLSKQETRETAERKERKEPEIHYHYPATIIQQEAATAAASVDPELRQRLEHVENDLKRLKVKEYSLTDLQTRMNSLSREVSFPRGLVPYIRNRTHEILSSTPKKLLPLHSQTLLIDLDYILHHSLRIERAMSYVSDVIHSPHIAALAFEDVLKILSKMDQELTIMETLLNPWQSLFTFLHEGFTRTKKRTITTNTSSKSNKTDDAALLNLIQNIPNEISRSTQDIINSFVRRSEKAHVLDSLPIVLWIEPGTHKSTRDAERTLKHIAAQCLPSLQRLTIEICENPSSSESEQEPRCKRIPLSSPSSSSSSSGLSKRPRNSSPECDALYIDFYGVLLHLSQLRTQPYLVRVLRKVSSPSSRKRKQTSTSSSSTKRNQSGQDGGGVENKISYVYPDKYEANRYDYELVSQELTKGGRLRVRKVIRSQEEKRGSPQNEIEENNNINKEQGRQKELAVSFEQIRPDTDTIIGFENLLSSQRSDIIQ